MIKITCKNYKSQQITLDFNGNFILSSYDSLKEYFNEITTSKLQSAGESLDSISTTKRTILLEFIYTHQKGARDLIYNVFNALGTLIHEEDGEKRLIDFVTESITITNNNYLRIVSVSLVCAFPYFRDEEETITTMTGLIGGFEFPLEISPDGFYIDQRVQKLVENIYNPSNIKTGMEISLKAINTVTNPVIKNLTTNEEFNILFSMQPNDLIIVDTKDNQKTITLIRNNTQIDIGYAAIFQDWVQLVGGDNIILYEAQYGVENLEVTIKNPVYYRGV